MTHSELSEIINQCNGGNCYECVVKYLCNMG